MHLTSPWHATLNSFAGVPLSGRPNFTTEGTKPRRINLGYREWRDVSCRAGLVCSTGASQSVSEEVNFSKILIITPAQFSHGHAF